VGGAGAGAACRAAVSTTLTLVRLRPDIPALTRAAARRGFLPPGGDPGYALHAALAALLGAAALRPFLLRETREGSELLGYTPAPSEELRALATLPPAGEGADLAEALRPESLEAKAMPSTWRQGQRLRFTLRARPIVRTRPEGRGGPHREHDVFAHVRCRASEGSPPSREAVYRDWLARCLGRDGAAALESAALIAYRSTRVLRRPANGATRKVAIIEGPDATFAGMLRVGDSEAFGRLLAAGLGRHCGFGFGMLLLSPSGPPPC